MAINTHGLPCTKLTEITEVHDEVKKGVQSGSWSTESSPGPPAYPYDSPQAKTAMYFDEVELSDRNDIESGLPGASTPTKQASTTVTSPEPSATVTSIGWAAHDEKNTLLVIDPQEQVVDPYKLSGFKLYMCCIIFVKLGLYVLYAFTLSYILQLNGLIIVTALVAAPSIISSAWHFLGLLRACVVAGAKGVRKGSRLD